ncbi:hypothetical protein [Xenorhabdus koppenhoeferi]|uniref:hypothetical protein n=1 Tax=Xenorhabdus koppenhoeferi TaxID=351659 RepID=UPI002B40646F|nr:hypothetical protein [Xenorhabdus sp. Vera]
MLCKNCYQFAPILKIKEKIISLTEESRNNVVQLVSRYNGQGFRVLILVTQELSTDGADYPLFVTDEKAMMQLGFITFLDRAKENETMAIVTLG